MLLTVADTGVHSDVVLQTLGLALGLVMVSALFSLDHELIFTGSYLGLRTSRPSLMFSWNWKKKTFYIQLKI